MANQFISGMTKYPSAGWYSTGAYLISGVPYLKTTAVLADEASDTIEFTAISREVTVLCVAGIVEVHFSDRPAADAQPSNCFTLSLGQSLTMPVRTKQITIRGEGGNSQASVTAILTGITDIADYSKFDDAGGIA